MECSPDLNCPYVDEIPGGLPFFHNIKNPPFDLLRYQLLRELDYFYETHSAIYSPRRKRPSNGASGDWQDTLNRHSSGLGRGDILPSSGVGHGVTTGLLDRSREAYS